MEYYAPRKHFHFVPWLLLITFAVCASASSFSVSHLPKPKIRSRFRHQHRSTNNARKHLNMTTHFYNQTIDHFNYRPESYRKFLQKFVVIDDYWGGAKANSPIFVYLGAEESINSDLEVIGLLEDNAPLFSALIVFIEHRYYGMSNPEGSIQKSLDDPEIRGYFSSAQVLADYAEIILFLKQIYKAEFSPVVVFGGSYGGMLATWFRLKYPHVAMGALASSAPIFMTIVPPDTYDNWVNKVYRDTSKTCYETIVQSWAKMLQLGLESNGLSRLSQKFNTCSTLNNTEDLGEFLVSVFREAAQYDAPPNYPVSQICRAIDGSVTGNSDLDKVAAGIAAFSNGSCLDVYAKDDETTLGWAWQICNELVDPMGSIFNSSILSVTPVTPFDLKTFVQNCMSSYGVATRPSWVETYYGARDLKLVLQKFGSNIIFSNGLKDPFSQEGVLESMSDTLVAVKAAGGSHCLDLHFAKEIDPDWLTTMRKKETEIMEGWLSNYYANLRAYSN